MASSSFLTLSPPLLFDPVQPDQSTSLFYDESNRQVLVLKNDGLLQVKSIDSGQILSLKLPLRPLGDEVFSVKLSPDCHVVALQTSLRVLDLYNLENGLMDYFQAPRSRGNIIGFCWPSSDDLIVITDQGVELFQVFRRKKQLKLSRSYSFPITWFIYSSGSSILATSHTTSNSVQFFQITSGSMIKLNRLELGRGPASKPILERDACLCELYGHVCFVLMAHDQQSLSDPIGTQVFVYTLQKDAPPLKSHVLLLELTGRFGLSVVDNLIVVHHQTSHTSLVYDIKMPGEVREKGVIAQKSVVPPYTIEPVTLGGKPYEMYSCNWILFQPNVIIDANCGCLWRLNIDLNLISSMISSPAHLVNFLLQRNNSQEILVKICREAISGQLWSENGHLMGTISLLFNKFNQKLFRPSSSINYNLVTLDQTDMYSKVFNLFDSAVSLLLIASPPYNNALQTLPDVYGIAVIFEYINSLVLNQVPILYSTYELLINLVVRSNRFYQLQQFIQYHVFTDSKPLACLLLSLHLKCSGCLQLALDMFKRLNMTRQDLIDIHLSTNSPSAVARAIRSFQIQDTCELPAGKFLEAALSSNDDKLLFSVYRLFSSKMTKTQTSEGNLFYSIHLTSH